jgi:hypothetical protein|tara:strand:+ start:2690 stop:3559 length:870 start_codon:yes stop_codon:yes gene_type:complete
MNKVVNTMGCSFSCNSYPQILQEKYNINVDSMARHSCGNEHIMRSVIWASYRHFKKYKTYENLYFIVQWSGLHRVEKLVTKKETIEYDDYVKNAEVTPIVNWDDWDNGIKESGWLFGTGWFHLPIWKKWFRFFETDEFAFIRTMESILTLQHFFKNNKITHKMILMENIFNDYSVDYYKGATISEPDGVDSGVVWNYLSENNLLSNKISKNTPLLKDIYPNSTHLWDIIDWNNWWLYENDYIENGGISEWCLFEGENPWSTEDDVQHPSMKNRELFTEKILLGDIDKWK